MSPEREGEAAPTPERVIIRRGALLGLLGATGLASLGRFASAIALTLGLGVAIVSALWLSDVVARLSGSREGASRPAARFDWKYGLKAVLRYLVMGAALFWAVRTVPAEVPWLLVGVSAVVLSIAIEGVLEARRASREGKSTA